MVEKEKLTLDVRQLSDGERGILALVLDLAKRLSQLNSAVADPVAKGEAVVLIDELDIHLHPKWQRRHHVLLRRQGQISCHRSEPAHSHFGDAATGKAVNREPEARSQESE